MSHVSTSISPISSLTLPPLSLYVHIPWCVQKCPYCDFNSHERKINADTPEGFDEGRYVNALKNDLLQEVTWAQGRKLHSIFFGGGTPSIFSAQAIKDIIDYAEKTIGFEDAIEITLEANPGTFEQEKFSGFFNAGINRLSIGIQSFQEKHLKKLGRIHNSDEAKRAIHIAQTAGFTNINIDLMHGLPEQDLDDAISDLTTAISFSPQHISWYQLTIEPNTAFYKQPPPLPVDDVLADIQYHGSQLLAQQGFQQYEISAFSRPDRPSKHNTNYWQFGDYIGIGAGAHGKITSLIDVNEPSIIRRQKTRLPEHYMDKATTPNTKQPVTKQSITKQSIAKQRPVDQTELPIEFLMNALRLNHGVPFALFVQRTGLALEPLMQAIKPLQQQGLLEHSSTTLNTTELGRRFLNTVLEKLSDHFE